MPLLPVFAVLIIAGVLLRLTNMYIPLNEKIKNNLNVVVLFSSINNIKV
jgi:hypothetical protein